VQWPSKRCARSTGLQVVSPWPPSSLDTGEEVEDQQLVIDVAVVVRDDGRVGIDGDDLNLTMWNHDPDRLQSALDTGAVR